MVYKASPSGACVPSGHRKHPQGVGLVNQQQHSKRCNNYYIYALRRYYINFLTSSENSCIATNKAIRNFCSGYYRVDDINYLCHIRYGMFPRNKSLALVIYCGNIPNGRDITNTYIYIYIYTLYIYCEVMTGMPMMQINKFCIITSTKNRLYQYMNFKNQKKKRTSYDKLSWRTQLCSYIHRNIAVSSI